MLYKQVCNKNGDKSNRWSLGLSLSVGGLILDMKYKKIIMGFKSNKAPGTDCIGPKLLKEISTEVIDPLLIFLISLSLTVLFQIL